MKKGLKIFLIILSAVVVIGGTVAVWQWDNITSFVYFMRYSTEDLENLEEKNKEELATAVAGLDTVPRDLTDEEKEALASGEITKQEAVELSLGVKKQDSQKATQSGTGTTQGKTDRTSELVAELYVLKSSYLSKLDGVAAQAKAEYAAKPKEERTASWKTAKISKYAGIAAGLEAECDAQVEGIITELKAEIKKTGGDMSIVNSIRSAYESEKQIKKAYYLNKYLK